MRRELGMLVALILLCTGLYFSNPAFVGSSNVVVVDREVAMLGIMAIGIGFVIITGGIDLSIGSIVGLTGVLIAKLTLAPSIHADGINVGGFGWPLWLAIVSALLCTALIGLIQGLLITRLKLQPFIVTLAGMLLLKGISETITRGGSLSLAKSLLARLPLTGFFDRHNGIVWIPYPVVIFFAVAALAIYVLHFTVFGRYVFAIGGNRDAAEYSGINVKRVEVSAYVISALLAGVAGICFAARIKDMGQQVGESFELAAITATVLGGCSLRGGEGSIIGIIIGTAIMKVIENGITMFGVDWKLNPHWTNIIIGATILLAVTADQIAHILRSRKRTVSAVEKSPRGDSTSPGGSMG